MSLIKVRTVSSFVVSFFIYRQIFLIRFRSGEEGGPIKPAYPTVKVGWSCFPCVNLCSVFHKSKLCLLLRRQLVIIRKDNSLKHLIQVRLTANPFLPRLFHQKHKQRFPILANCGPHHHTNSPAPVYRLYAIWIVLFVRPTPNPNPSSLPCLKRAFIAP